MSKPLGQATAYLIGFEDGPVKIGVTSRNVRERLSAGRREIGSRDIEIFGTWPHRHAYLIEKFAHMYLRHKHFTREWFDASVREAKQAIDAVVKLVGTSRTRKVTKGNWFERHGIRPRAVKQCFGVDANQLISEWYQRVFSDWAYQKQLRDLSGETVRREAAREKTQREFKAYIRKIEREKSRGTIVSILGPRSTAQHNYRAAQKRKKAKAA